MTYTIQAYLTVVAVAALFIGVLLLPAALLVVIHEAAQKLRALPREFPLAHHAPTTTAPVTSARD